MKKKPVVSEKDKKDWENYLKELGNNSKKKNYFPHQDIEKNKIKKLDLHGFPLDESNKMVEKFILDSYNKGFKKLLLITGKGSRSQAHKNPYVSEKLSILKYSIPEFIKSNKNLNGIINKVTQAGRKHGGEGAIYIFLKKNIL